MKDKLNLTINEDLKKAIKKQAISEGRSASNIVEELLTIYLLQAKEGER